MSAANRAGEAEGVARVRAAVDAAKHALGERAPVWWSDGALEWQRHMARNTAYTEWFATV
ncbi:hypothetical protein [Sphingomonas bisphenolicum]|uniref:Uncharacterized protein n=1 Tax=Sphingomonas bisphenolicum TaxID=296544 RepID=A0ABM7G0R5_9SPHN|nr:hypothetical protein [Sphingomonas bisphenolicum]BBF68826.1 hypothetical protein SBA_ch1_10260 [Sphingomonas bisphenolicum]